MWPIGLALGRTEETGKTEEALKEQEDKLNKGLRCATIEGGYVLLHLGPPCRPPPDELVKKTGQASDQRTRETREEQEKQEKNKRMN